MSPVFSAGKGIVAPLAGVPGGVLGSPITYHFGPLLREPELYLVYWGRYWSGGANPTARQITDALGQVLSSAYMRGLSEYGPIRTAAIADSLVVDFGVGTSPPDAPNQFTANDIEAFLNNLILAGYLPQPIFVSPIMSALYIVILPPTAVAAPSSPGGVPNLGEHGALPFPHFPWGAWAWVVGNPLLQGLDAVTATLCHELVEACTDPVPPTGWSGPPPPGFPANSAFEIGDAANGDNVRLPGGPLVQRYWSNAHAMPIAPVAVLPLIAPPGPAALGVPRNGWVRNVPPSSGGACNPVNPDVASFHNQMTPRGMGVHMDGRSTTVQCCSCIAETLRFSLPGPLNTDQVDLAWSWFAATRGPNDPNSVAGIGIQLLLNGQPHGDSVMCVSERRATNNCAGAFTQQFVVPNQTSFRFELGGANGLARNTVFDAVEFSLLSYACGVAANSVEIAGLMLVAA
jgi:hypothetical protein